MRCYFGRYDFGLVGHAANQVTLSRMAHQGGP
jgi:hypothetical protein